MAITLPEEAEAWIEAYRRRLNENAEFAAAASGWGVEFDGDFVFVMQPDDYDGEAIAFYVELCDGECLQTAVLDNPNDVAHGFTLRGPYSAWQQLLDGEVDIVEAVMNGSFDVDGNKLQAMRYQHALVEMGETATRIDTDFEY